MVRSGAEEGIVVVEGSLAVPFVNTDQAMEKIERTAVWLRAADMELSKVGHCKDADVGVQPRYNRRNAVVQIEHLHARMMSCKQRIITVRTHI